MTPAPAAAYCNHAGTSWPKPDGVAVAVARTIALPPAQRLAVYDRVHAQVCAWLGVESPDRLLFTPGCTAALSIAIGDLPWQAGDVVITSALEHHGLLRPIDKLVAERGVVHRVAPCRAGQPVDLDWVAHTLSEGGVRLVAHTGASNITGQILPTARLAALAHAHGALHLLDAAQVAGVVDLDVRSLDTDILTLAGHKGPLGPLGVGLFWAHPRVRFTSPAATCTLGPDGRPTQACNPFPGFCDVGSVNMGGVAGLGAGLSWLSVHGAAATDRSRAMARQLREEVGRLEGVALVGGDQVPHTATVALKLDPLPLDQTEAFFAARGVTVRAGRHCAPLALETLGLPDGVLRISFGATSRPGDVDAVIAALHAAVGLG